MTPVQIVTVEKRPKGLFRITDSQGTKYATQNAWLASLCEQARATGSWVEVDSKAGWYYRECMAVKPVEPQQVSA